MGVVTATVAFVTAGTLGSRAVAYATKPFVVLSCMGMLAAAGARQVGRDGRRLAPWPLRGWVLAGLAWSLGGDIALMLPSDAFVVGLCLFLMGHLCYLVAFTRSGWRVTPGPALAVGAYLMLIVTLLLPSLGPMRAPVVGYAVVISLMAWQALERAAAHRTTAARLVAAGAVLFVISDTTLAVHRFLGPLPWERVLVMTTYALAQYDISLGAARETEPQPLDASGA